MQKVINVSSFTKITTKETKGLVSPLKGTATLVLSAKKPTVSDDRGTPLTGIIQLDGTQPALWAIAQTSATTVICIQSY